MFWDRVHPKTKGTLKGRSLFPTAAASEPSALEESADLASAPPTHCVSSGQTTLLFRVLFKTQDRA